MRLTNSADQSTVKSALPDNVAGLAEALPSLRTGECIVVGEATVLPTRVLVELPAPAPDAADPSLEGWRRIPAQRPVVDAALRRWRGIE